MLTGEGVGAAWPLLVTTGDNGVITANCVLVETGIREGSDMTEDFEKTSIRYSPPQVMTVDEVAIYLGFTEATIRRMLRDREMPAAKVAGQWRFLKTEVDRWLADLSKQLVDPVGAETVVLTSDLRRLLEVAGGRNSPEDEAVGEILQALASLISEAEGSLEEDQLTFEEALDVFSRPPADQQTVTAEDKARLRGLHGPEAKAVRPEALVGLANMLMSGEVDKDEALSLLAGLPDVDESQDEGEDFIPF